MNKDQSYTYILENREIWFIPIINIDAYSFIEKNYKSTSQIVFISKNLRTDSFTNATNCGNYGFGVDLNCNFPFQYKASTQGGCSNDPCNPFYRGQEKLSEKETKTIDSFLQQHDFNIGVNYFRFIKNFSEIIY